MLLDRRIDVVAIDSRKTEVSRVVVVAGAAAVTAANFGPAVGATWLAVAALGEFWGWLVSRHQVVDREASRGEQLGFVLAVLLRGTNWSALTVMLWLSGKAGLQSVAIVIAAGQLIHAQAFAFKSPIVLAINAVIPGLFLIVMPLGFGGYRGLELATVAFGVTLALLYVAAGAHANMVTASHLRSANAKLERAANVDALTGLANRRRFTSLFQRLLAPGGTKARFSLVLIDLDRFKQINDTLGHEAGDTILVETARRLRAVVRGSDLVSRLGGDEFAILIQLGEQTQLVEALCQRIVASFADAIDCQGRAVVATPSIGFAVYPDHGETEDRLYKSADLALYTVKKNGRNAWRSYEALAA